MDRTERKLAGIWVAMLALTLSSYLASESTTSGAAPAIATVVIAAMVKARFVLMTFMEVGHAPLVLRVVLEAWLVALAAVLIILAV